MGGSHSPRAAPPSRWGKAFGPANVSASPALTLTACRASGGHHTSPGEVLFACLIFGRAACGILVHKPGIESLPLGLEVQGFNHLTTREVPLLTFNIERMRLEG